MPEKTLLAFADHGEVGEPIPADGGDADEKLAAFEDAGIDVAALAARLQDEGKESFNAPGASCSETLCSKQLV